MTTNVGDPTTPTNGEYLALILDVLGQPELEPMIAIHGPRTMTPGRCFGNALEVAAREHHTYKLVLGLGRWAGSNMAWLDHAWLIDTDGVCWDPTWPGADEAEYRGHIIDDLVWMWRHVNHWRFCAATTRRGIRCKRWAMFPSELCSQHGGWTWHAAPIEESTP